MRRGLLLLVAAIAFSPLRADALTVRDVIELTRAGLGEEILLALVEVDRSVFPIDTETLKTLKAAGVSERVIVAMIRSARTPAADLPERTDIREAVAPQQAPQVIVIEHEQPVQIREVPVAVPVYIPVATRSHGGRVHTPQSHDGDGGSVTLPPTYDGRDRASDKHTKPPEPVYWGWGGKLRPDAWKPQ